MDTVILCGIEAQACVQQTVIDLLEKGYNVHVIADAVSSRSMVDRYVLCLFYTSLLGHGFFIIRFTDPPTVYFGVWEKNKIAFTYFFYSRRLP